jgi:predicted Zn-dependent peptidase
MKLINEVYDSMKSITDEELDNAKAKLISSYESIGDDLNSIYIRLLVEELMERPSVDENIEVINSITKEEVEAVYNLLKLNTIYVLKGE